jgi:hypothetical protein
LRLKFITGNLPADELVVGQIVIERANDEIAVMVSALAIIVVLESAALRESRNIQPMPRPSFPVARRG